MGLITKIEDLINRALMWLWDKFLQLGKRLVPSAIKRFWEKFTGTLARIIAFFKSLPKLLFQKVKEAPQLLQKNYKGIFVEAIDAGKKAFKKSQEQHSPLKGILSAFTAPFLFLFQWAQSLKPAHFVLLFLFTTASVLSVLGIAIKSHEILERETTARAPASAPVDTYERPEYYKKDKRELSFNNIKIPIYVEGINELRAVVIDFSVVASNRATRDWMAKHEFEIRDHLTLTIEPVVPTFPMSDEGRIVITDKLHDEIQYFLDKHQVEGHIQEVRIIYILGH